MRSASLLLATALIATVPAAAQAGFAVGGSVGSARTEGGDFEGRDTGWKAIAGFYGKFVGGEVNYIDFGEFGGGGGPSARAIAPAVIVGVPAGHALIYGKGGVSFADVDGTSVSEEYKDEDPYWGVGARFGYERGLGFRVEYERFYFENQDVDLASAGVELRF